ncbi:MAG: CheW domain-containing protein [Snowella sp.]|nr:CheW domain-containing protein [Snowella sp.]
MNQPAPFSVLDPNNLGSLPEQATLGQTEKFLVFTVGKLNLALAVPIVERILSYTPIHGSGTTASGIIHLQDRSVTVVDLYQRLFKVKQPQSSQSKQFLILARNSANESFGILINETPSLFDVPLSQVRVLPDSYRHSDTLNMASHVMIITNKDQSFTVFLLDSDRLISPG